MSWAISYGTIPIAVKVIPASRMKPQAAGMDAANASHY
jgi:hypothetical protein